MPPMNRLVLAAALLATACSNSADTPPATAPFEALSHTPGEGAEVYLNDPITVSFTTQVDLESVSLDTLRIEERDATGTPTGIAVAGTFELANNGTMLWFQPAIARDGAFATGGLRADRVYRVELADGGNSAAPALRDVHGKPLVQPLAFTFRTRTGTTAAMLYRDRSVFGPHRSGFDVTPGGVEATPLNLFGQAPVEVRLHFDQPLDPSPDNLPLNVQLDPTVRDASARGNVFLEYDDPEDPPGTFRWLPAAVELERNDAQGATVVLRPVGVLPNAATVRVIVEAAVRDVAGQSNLATANHNRVFGTFRTKDAWTQQWNVLLEAFATASAIDHAAMFADPAAEVGPGYVRAAPVFEGGSDSVDFAAPANETLLSTAFTTFVPVQGPPQEVTGGVFHLRNLTIPDGATVQGVGQNPLVFLCRGKVTIGGTLSANGGRGVRDDTAGGQYYGPGDRVGTGSLGHYANAGGIGRCGGGDGGAGSADPLLRDMRGATGRGPGQQVGGGGRGGYLSCVTGCYTGFSYGNGGGSGGGGGTFATQGDPWFRGTSPTNIQPNTPPSSFSAFQQKLGFGGTGCSGNSGTRTAFLSGGEPGPRAFTDSRVDNNFFGDGFDLHRGLRIRGELTTLQGGGGGGGGGDTSPGFVCSLNGNNPTLDHRGGGGGGGGGCIVIKSLGEIWITANGRISADGGHGGGGEQSGACIDSGGGGGGAGGMVLLLSAVAIRIEAHGDVATNRFVYGSGNGGPFAGNEYSFAISADGGVCTTGTFGTVNVTGKYPLSGQLPISGTTYDQDPLGGFGGMGIVQLLAPTGDNSDGTNTALDDNIYFYLPGQLSIPQATPLGAAAKRQLLAWRGFPGSDGTHIDDSGAPVMIGNEEGDIRPAPVLLPSPFGARSRVRSKWIDTGQSARRPLLAADGQARGLVLGNGAEPGPMFELPGIDLAGYAQWATIGASVTTQHPVVVTPNPIANLDAAATHDGLPAYRVQLAQPILGNRGDRFAGYDAELLDPASSTLATFRILAHDASTLHLAPAGLLPTAATHLRIVARILELRTTAGTSLPATTLPGTSQPVPTANARIGFAFHTDPNPAHPGGLRFPYGNGTFTHDLTAPDLRLFLTTQRPRYVMWDVVFDSAYTLAGNTPPLDPAAPRLELTGLRLPFHF